MTASPPSESSRLDESRIAGGPQLAGFRVSGMAGLFAVGEVAAIPGAGELVVEKSGCIGFTRDPDYAGPVPPVTFVLLCLDGGKPSLLEIADVAPELEVTVPLNWQSWLRPGLNFTFASDETGTSKAAIVRRVSADPAGETLTVWARFAESLHQIPPGMTGTARFQPPGG